MVVAVIIILVIVVIVLAISLYLQTKAAKAKAEEGEQLLKDYQKRVDEQPRLREDYDSLSKYFENIGKGYEQALLLFDKMADIRQNLEIITQNDKDPDSVERLKALLVKFDRLQG